MGPKPYDRYEIEQQAFKVQQHLKGAKVLLWLAAALFVANFIAIFLPLTREPRASVGTCVKFCPAICSQMGWTSPQSSSDQVVKSRSISVRGSGDVVEESAPDMAIAATNEPDLTTLDRRWGYGDLRSNVKLGMAVFFSIDRVMSWWNMGDSCESFHNSTKDKVNCVWGAVSSTISLGGVLVVVYNAGSAFKLLLDETGLHASDFALTSNKRNTIDPAVLDELTMSLGSQVSYRGIYQHNHPGPGMNGSEQQEASYHHVFHVQHNGTDFHFAHMGNATGRPTYRIGLGTGTPTEPSIAGRAVYNDYYFRNSGVDFYADPNPSNINYDKGTINVNTDYGWIFDQVACIMGTGTNMNSNGFWFQIYDEYHKGTMIAGSIAPIGPGGVVSKIFNFPVKGSITPPAKC